MMTSSPASQGAVTVIVPSLTTLRAGSSALVHVRVVVAEGYHVQANPAASEFLVPLRLELKPKDGVRPGPVSYPPGLPHRLQGASDVLLTYKGDFQIAVPLEAGASAQPGRYLLPGILRYQACNEHTCLFPASVPSRLAVRIIRDLPRPARAT